MTILTLNSFKDFVVFGVFEDFELLFEDYYRAKFY